MEPVKILCLEHFWIKLRPMNKAIPILLLLCLSLSGILVAQTAGREDMKVDSSRIKFEDEVITGAERYDLYINKLKGKRVALVANQTSMVEGDHLVDKLLELGVEVKRIFSPEHGFRGGADAGATVKDAVDVKTGINVRSLYGKNKKPTPADLHNIDVVIFDIQDVGVRFYTYISTMHYVMEACAENNVEFWVFDRPNPNGFWVDGPVLQKGLKSFVGMHPVPLVHGMTVAEYARMINGEGWLKDGMKCKLEVVTCVGWDHNDYYQLPIPPSPNLPNMTSVYLYPALALFEGTVISVGRGTDFPFQVFGSPYLQAGNFEFTPSSRPGATSPKYEGMVCRGFDLRSFGRTYLFDYRKLYLSWLYVAYNNSGNKSEFFLKNNFFDLLAGNRKLRQQIKDGVPEQKIRKSWEKDLSQFMKIRKKYLLYDDFSGK